MHNQLVHHGGILTGIFLQGGISPMQFMGRGAYSLSWNTSLRYEFKIPCGISRVRASKSIAKDIQPQNEGTSGPMSIVSIKFILNYA